MLQRLAAHKEMRPQGWYRADIVSRIKLKRWAWFALIMNTV